LRAIHRVGGHPRFSQGVSFDPEFFLRSTHSSALIFQTVDDDLMVIDGNRPQEITANV
jgi:hypothetical protein